MFLPLEENILTVSAPEVSQSPLSKACPVVFEQNRYFIYSINALVVILLENQDEQIINNPRVESKRNSSFELWQVWQYGNEKIKSISVNQHKMHRVAKGAIALCIEEGRGVLLMPQTSHGTTRNTSSSTIATLEESRRSTRGLGSGGANNLMAMNTTLVEQANEYTRVHLNLHIPTWKETLRWKSEDRHLDKFEWVESGDDLYLFGCGEKVTLWKIVDDAVQVYFQRAFTVCEPERLGSIHNTLFDVSQSGKYVATNCAFDRLTKVWAIHQLKYDGTPTCLFLPHERSIKQLSWGKGKHSYKLIEGASTCEMLFCLDRNGTMYIWRENNGSMSFLLWKKFDMGAFYPEIIDPLVTDELKMKSFGLVNHYWARNIPVPTTSSNPIIDALLDETNVLSALCNFHYGYSSLDEARNTNLFQQHGDGLAKINSKLLGDRTGTFADTHAGERMIQGNPGLQKSFNLFLLYSILKNGDFVLYKAESASFSGVSPRVSLLTSYSGMAEQLKHAQIYAVSSLDFHKERQGGVVNFIVEILFQPLSHKFLRFARLRLSPDSTSKTSYAVQSVDLGDMCKRMSSANTPDCNIQSLVVKSNYFSSNVATSKLSGNKPAPIPLSNYGGPRQPAHSTRVIVSCLDDKIEVYRASTSLQVIRVVSGQIDESGLSSVRHAVFFDRQSILFYFGGRRMRAAKLLSHISTPVSDSKTPSTSPTISPGGSGSTNGTKSGSETLPKKIVLCFTEEEQTNDIDDLLLLSTSEEGRVSYCFLIGYDREGLKFQHWLFRVEGDLSDLNSDIQVELVRRHQTIFSKNIVAICSIPTLDHRDFMIASIDSELTFSIWKLVDNELKYSDLELSTIHSVNLVENLGLSNISTNSTFVEGLSGKFIQLSLSTCGRMAVLIKDTNNALASSAGVNSKRLSLLAEKGAVEYRILIMGAFDKSPEAVISLPLKKYNQVFSVEWSPSTWPERDCSLIFISATCIGVIRYEKHSGATRPMWNIVACSPHFTIPPQIMSSSIESFPRVILNLKSSLARLDLSLLREFVGDASTWREDTISPLGSVKKFNSFLAHHPITLLFLLLRGSFHSLEIILDHIKDKITEHEDSCYLRMSDDVELKRLPLIEIAKLLRLEEPTLEERSATYLSGKPKPKENVSSAAPARARDLFAMDFSSRWSGGGDRAEDLFAPRSIPRSTDRAENLFAPSPLSTDTKSKDQVDKPSENEKWISALDTDKFPNFFKAHTPSLTFLPSKLENDFLLAIVSGMKKIVQWDRDATGEKDEPALRFQASLLFPYQNAWEFEEDTSMKDLDSTLQQSTPTSPRAQTTQSLPEVGQEASDKQKQIEQSNGICSEQVVWAALSDHQANLTEQLFPTNQLLWKDMKAMRIPFWMKSCSKLFFFTEKVAQAEYAATKDPFQVAVFYVLLGKTKLLSSLFKMGQENRIAELLVNDFSDERWKNAAIKNAYVLKAKQRYELSATFFLLGGKVQEAVSLAEHADPTLVLSFLIARISEKWDLGNVGENKDDAMTNYASSLRMTSMRSLNFGGERTGTEKADMEKTSVCKDFLNTIVWEKAQACGDIYASFLVKYICEDVTAAVQCLLNVPDKPAYCMFGNACVGTLKGKSDIPQMTFSSTPATSTDQVPPIVKFRSSIYWQAFGSSLLAASEIVRYLRKNVITTAVMREKALSLHGLTCQRLLSMGFNIMALFQMNDLRAFEEEVRRQRPRALALDIFKQSHGKALMKVLTLQVDFIVEQFEKSLTRALTDPSTLKCDFPLDELVHNAVESLLKSAFKEESEQQECDYMRKIFWKEVFQYLSHTNRCVALDFLLASPTTCAPSLPLFGAVPIHQLIEKIIEDIAFISSGDLTKSSVDFRFTKQIDQRCSELLDSASELCYWLFYFYSKSIERRNQLAGNSADYVRVATAAIYSIIAICSRYSRSPCCLHRTLTVVFPHKDHLPKKLLEEIMQIAMVEYCTNCTLSTALASKLAQLNIAGASSLQRDLPTLFQTVRYLKKELHVFASDVKTHRLHLRSNISGNDDPSSQQQHFAVFSFCQYWNLLMMIVSNAMPIHLTKVAIEGSPATSKGSAAAKRLVQVWFTYNNNLSRYATKKQLYDMSEAYFRPGSSTSSSNHNTMPSGAGTNTGATSTGNSGPSAPSTGTSNNPGASIPQHGATVSLHKSDSRQLLRCACEKCPWFMMMKLFVDKEELLLRLNTQLECCSEKIKDEISWGHLPELPQKKAALTRSQRLLLSSVAAVKVVSAMTSPPNTPGKALPSAPATPNARLELADLIERKLMIPSSKLSTQCIYRSEVSIKGMCFNRVTETNEMILCSSKGICRTACTDYSDGSNKFHFKGMYANPQLASFSSPVMSEQFRKTASMPSNTSSPSDGKTPSFKPTTVESHPFLPLFVSGTQKGKLNLWSYDSLSALCSFKTRAENVVVSMSLSTSLSSRRDIKKIQFDNLGQQMAACDTHGHLFMWKFSNLEREYAYRELEAHDKGAKAVAYINSGSSIATAGSSSDKRSVCMWDMLLPNHKALVCAPTCHPAGAASLAFSSIHQLLISGGEGGSISVFDLRQRRVLHTITGAHETAITTLELHPSGRCVLSGSASGDLKVWSLPIFREIASVPKVHAKTSFLGETASNLLGDAASNMAINVTNSSWGVTDAVATDKYFFTSGTDGSVQRLNVPSLGRTSIL